MKKVVVIGAGLSGMTLAWALRKKGHDVTIIDRRPRVGGAIYSEWAEGFLCEAGANTFQLTHPRLESFLADLGLTDSLVEPSREAKTRYILRDNELIPLPTRPQEFLRSKVLSGKGKARLLKEPMVGVGNSKEDESFATFIRRRLGEEAYTYLADPFVSGIYAGDPEKLSVRSAFPQIWAMEQKAGSIFKGMRQRKKEKKTTGETFTPRLVSFRDGLGMIPEALHRGTEDRLILDAFVEKLEPTERGWKITYKKEDEERTLLCDDVCSAIPAHRLSALNIAAPVSGLLKEISKIEYPPVSVIHLGFKRDQIGHALDGFGMLYPAVEERRILGTVFASSLFPGRCPEGHALLTTFVGGARQSDIARYDDASLYECVLNDIVPLLRIHGEPVFFRRYHWEKAIPQFNIGHEKILADIQTFEDSLPGLHIVGNYRDGISIGNAILGALNRAEKIHEEMKK